MSHLAPCPACNRHVDAGESACPFCAAALPVSLRAQQLPATPRRLSRAALLAAGATLIGAAACNNPPAPAPVPLYGGPFPTGGTGGTTGSGGTTGTGGTAPQDAGQDGSR